jgi:uncharacterized membrane protein YedE/YeeE
LAGLLAVLSVALTGKYLGTSTTFARAAGGIEQIIDADRVAANEFYQNEKIVFDWQAIMVIGIALGALLASRTGKTFKLEAVPPMWAERFGPSFGKRAVVAFIGGAFALFGARMAGGCPSGHGLSGMMALSVSGLIAMAGFMIGGFSVANLIYRRK